jgi:quercetin dioxygenase-like cupin family protein
MIEECVARCCSHDQQETAFGKLVWKVSAACGNSDKVTVGTCYINPGCANARHFHPNCDEVLTVSRGRIAHTLADEEIVMEVGDVIVIPTGIVHNARNIGDEIAELSIFFSSAFRETVLETS